MRNVVILGGGPAGLTAAIYAARANLAPLVIEGNEAGGQLMITTLVENYPGFEEAIMGPALMQSMRNQAERVGAEFITEDVTAVDLRHRPFAVTTQSGQRFEGRALIVATGASAKMLGVPGEASVDGSWGVHVRDVRWFLLSEKRRGGGRRGRFCDGRGPLSGESRAFRDDHPSS